MGRRAEPRMWLGQERKPVKSPRRNRGGRVDVTVTLESSVFLLICFFIHHQEKVTGFSGCNLGFFVFPLALLVFALRVLKLVFRCSEVEGHDVLGS